MILIDADALIERWNNMSVRGRTEFDQEIMVAPTIDIVRCKDCRWLDKGENESCSWSMCTRHFGQYINVNAEDFCSYGEVRDE